MDLRLLVAVFLGGTVGTGLRLAISETDADASFPASTLAINVIGSFALGLLVAGTWSWASPTVRAALGPGLLGSFTTFSAAAVGTVTLVEADETGLALAYIAATVGIGLAAAWLGLRLGAPRNRGESR
jgi:CrcB protein